MLETLRANMEAMRITEVENDLLAVQRTEAVSKYEELAKVYNLQTENLEGILSRQMEPCCSYEAVDDVIKTVEEISAEEQQFLDTLEPDVECVEGFEYVEVEGTPMSEIYARMNHDEPDETGRFPRSKKKKGNKKRKSTNSEN